MNEIDWPKKGDKLFTEDGGLHNSCINWVHDRAKIGLYAGSFEEASLFLINHVVDNRSELDTFIYPIIYCFRHSLELTFKGIIKIGIEIWDEFEVQRVPKTHDLFQLWNLVKKILIEFFPNQDRSILKCVESCIKEIDQADRFSMTFRYPEDLNGNQHLPGMKYINTANLRKTMNALANFFHGANDALSEIKDQVFSQRMELDSCNNNFS